MPLPVEVRVLQYAPPPIAAHSLLKLHGSPITFAAATQAPIGQVRPGPQEAQKEPPVPQAN